MGISFLGFEIAKRALLAHRQAMDVAGHNVANANTPGYSRQRANLRTTPPFPEAVGLNYAGIGQIGTGVEVAQITRVRDSFLDRQYWSQSGALGRWQTRDQVLGEIEYLVNEPSDYSLRALMDQWWESWQGLANNPESQAAREAVKQRALALVEAFQFADRQLNEMRMNLNSSIENKAKEINGLAAQIAALNERIAYVTGVGQAPNDLLDQREQLVDRLSRIVDLVTVDAPNGMIRVLVDGVALVDGVRANRLLVEADPANGKLWRLRWEGFSTIAQITSGELGAYFELRDAVVPYYKQQLTDLIRAIATETNNIHRRGADLNGASVAGTAWEDFFVNPDPAAFDVQTLAVNPAIVADVRRIAAAAQQDHPGDGSNALAISNIRYTHLTDLDGFNTDDFYRSMVGVLGAQAQEAQRMAESQKLLVDQLDHQRQSVSGVNIDEEMMEIIKSQHAFNAAARLVNVMDEMLDTIINRLGILSR